MFDLTSELTFPSLEKRNRETVVRKKRLMFPVRSISEKNDIMLVAAIYWSLLEAKEQIFVEALVKSLVGKPSTAHPQQRANEFLQAIQLNPLITFSVSTETKTKWRHF